MNRIEFFVPGLPATQGSKKHVGNGILVESCKRLPEWRKRVQFEFDDATHGCVAFDGPVGLTCRFRMPRPKSHYRTGKHAGELKPDAPEYCNKRPDTTKMVRAVEDALSGRAFKDDAQVAVQHNEKKYSNNPRDIGVSVEIRGLSATE